MVVKVKVRCISCKATKDVDQAEAERLTATDSVPMCECGMVMVAVAASARRGRVS